MKICNMDINKLNDKTIDIFGTRYTIKIVDTLDDDTKVNHYGVTINNARIIKISKNVNGESQPDDELNITFLHELIHAILDTGQYLTCSSDEPLVEWLARSLYSLIKQDVL